MRSGSPLARDNVGSVYAARRSVWYHASPCRDRVRRGRVSHMDPSAHAGTQRPVHAQQPSRRRFAEQNGPGSVSRFGEGHMTLAERQTADLPLFQYPTTWCPVTPTPETTFPSGTPRRVLAASTSGHRCPGQRHPNHPAPRNRLTAPVILSLSDRRHQPGSRRRIDSCRCSPGHPAMSWHLRALVRHHTARERVG